MAGSYRDEDEPFKAAVFYGQKPALTGDVVYPRRRPLAQNPDAVEQIRELVRTSMMESIPPAMAAGAEAIEKKYSTTSFLIVGSLVVTAIATSVLAISAAIDHKWI